MDHRIFGIETEFGCLVRDPAAGKPDALVEKVKTHARAGESTKLGVGKPDALVEKVKDHAFYRMGLGVIDLHARDYTFEPARSGGFLLNGGRLYIDAVGDHEEYATAECQSIVDVVTHEKAGQRILQKVVDDLGLADCVSFHNNSIDHFGGHTFGCHENYLVALDDDFFKDSVAGLLPFLVTRQIFAGAGRVGGHRLNRTDFRNNVMRLGEHEVDYIWVHNFYGVEIDPSVDFQLSQRADHILRTVASKVRFNRAIINPKWDSYYNFSNLHRLHLLYGEANQSEYASALKIGTTCAVLDLVEMDVIPDSVRLADPIRALKEVSRDPEWRWIVKRLDGSKIGAVDLQRIYLELAQQHLAGKDAQTDWVLREWEYVLAGLELDPMTLADRLDWVAKRKLFQMYMDAEGVGWQDDMLQSLDLEYHNANPETGLYYGLVQAGQTKRVTTDEAIEAAVTAPPPDTRALGRSRVIQGLLDSKNKRYVIDWDSIYVDRERFMDLRNPFHTYKREAEKFAAKL